MSGITGIDRLRRDAAVFERVLGDVVGRELRSGIDAPLRTFKTRTDTAIRADFPARYAAVFGGSWRVVVSATSGSASLRVKLRGTAKGRSSIRDSAALNRGVLRHKRWGKPPWYSQAVRPGFWDDPAKALAVDVRRAAEDAVAKAASTVEGDL